MPRPDERSALLITVVVVILVAIGIGVGLFFTYRELGNVREANADLYKRIRDAEKKKSMIPALEEEISVMLGDLVLYEEILPDEKEIENIMDLLNDFKKEAEIEIISLTPQRARAVAQAVQQNYERHAYSIKLRGTYFRIMRFINLLETHNRFIRIDKFDIKQKDMDLLINDITLDISTFSFKAPAGPVVAGGPAR